MVQYPFICATKHYLTNSVFALFERFIDCNVNKIALQRYTVDGSSNVFSAILKRRLLKLKHFFCLYTSCEYNLFQHHIVNI